ncbi:MAG: ribosome biogenesis GTPase Der [Gammaproteobacteria bacterium TMED78]|nr:MAG: ribosome biogenesis GTPase Der [Gammaproteobacteria bacterium TMED78]|tara:strand:- start:44506 stop:45891 length:1386 start_codon:yes stop_codon:yes gene_type:complete
MLPAIALVGRPNVGKSTIFNQLTHSRNALVADYPGLTRDRRYGIASHNKKKFIIIDTGGLVDDSDSQLSQLAKEQTNIAIQESNIIILVVDLKEGLTSKDQEIAKNLRKLGKPVFIAVNKSEGEDPSIAESEFFSLALGTPVSITAINGKRISVLLDHIIAESNISFDQDEEIPSGPHIAVVGRPNVGKSTLINRLIGEKRLLTSNEPGTTRDSILVPCQRGKNNFILVDTAGIRRRSKVNEKIEKFSIVQSLNAIEDSAVVIFLIDAQESITDQDLHLIGLVIERGRALTIGVNKWDNLDPIKKRQVSSDITRKLSFAGFSDINNISALHGSGIDSVIASALRAYDDSNKEFKTSFLNEILYKAQTIHQPPLVAGRRIRLSYAHQGGRRPQIIIIHGNRVNLLPSHYRRFLNNFFCKCLRIKGAPIRIEFKTGHNPYAGKKNILTKKQLIKRKRIIRHKK